MMMKKNVTPIMIIVLAVSLLVVTAFAGTSKQTGYEAFKEVLRHQKSETCSNGTLTGRLEIVDNGETMATLIGKVKGDPNAEVFNGELNLVAHDLNKKVAIFGDDQKFYIHDQERNDVYVTNVTHDDSVNEDTCSFDEGHEMTSDEEAVLDYFVGDLAHAFSVNEKADGTAEIQLELQKNEIPEIVNLLVSVDKEERHSRKHSEDATLQALNSDAYPLFKEIMALETDKTDLVEDIEIAYIRLALEVDAQDQMTGMAFEVKVAGMDAHQNLHNILYKGSAKVSNRNSSTIEALDLTEKNLIQMPEFEEK